MGSLLYLYNVSLNLNCNSLSRLRNLVFIRDKKVKGHSYAYLVKNTWERVKLYDIEGLTRLFDKYSRIFGLVKIYERILTPVMYRVGDLWEQGPIDIATEHICSNASHTLVKIIGEKISSSLKNTRNAKRKILLCTPEGELHILGCMIIESILSSKNNKSGSAKIN